MLSTSSSRRIKGQQVTRSITHHSVPPTPELCSSNLQPKPHHSSFRPLQGKKWLLIIYFLPVLQEIWGQDPVVIYRKTWMDDKCSDPLISFETFPLLSSVSVQVEFNKETNHFVGPI